jgi:hypothetical protein
VSKKLAGIRLVSIELEVSGKPATEGAETLQQLLASGLSRDAKLAGVSDMDFDLIAFPEFKRLDHGGGKADGKAVSPFGDLHAHSLSVGYTILHMYIHCWSESRIAGRRRGVQYAIQRR